jgi:hypothetical protein
VKRPRAALRNPFDGAPNGAAEPDARRETTLGEALDELDRQARDVLTRIANEPARGLSTDEYHGDLCGIETAIGDMLVALAKRRM